MLLLAADESSGAYQAGQVFGRVFAILLVFALVRWGVRKLLARERPDGGPAPPSSRWLPNVIAAGVALLLAFGSVAADLAGDDSISDQDRTDFVAGCEASARGTVDCSCILDELEGRGYDTLAKIDDVTATIGTPEEPSWARGVFRGCAT